tara:strand:- start:1866 stop:2333 length:468 start_codon:yes stop_codon:yes gene_type:complete
MVTFKSVSEQDIEDRIALRRRESEERLEAARNDDMKGIPAEYMARMISGLERSLAPGGMVEQDANGLRRDMAHPPAQRLRGIVDYWLPHARADWNDRDEYWCESNSQLPMICEILVLLDFGEVGMAFAAMADKYQGCFSEYFDPKNDIWMDVVFA